MHVQIAPIHAGEPQVADQPRARGTGMLRVGRRSDQTVIRDLAQSGSTKLLFPRSRTGMTAVILNSAGGVTGGDRFDISAHAEAGTQLTLTTQAAERAYRAQPGETGRVSSRLTLETGARLNWLPQETILFDGAHFDRRLHVDMAIDAQFVLVEPLILGRAAMGEALRDFALRDRIDIIRDGEVIYADRTRLDGAALARTSDATLGDNLAAANLLWASPQAEVMLDHMRDSLAAGPALGGVSLIREGLLACRLLAPSGYDLRATLMPLIETLTGASLPRTWML